MNLSAMPDPTILCQRCSRVLSAERPVRLPDNRVYCAACCESMAADIFEMETGETFTKWIEKHPQLVMQYQPLALTVRRFGFFFPLAIAGLWVMYEKAFWIADNLLARFVVFLFIAGIPIYGFYGCMTYGRP